VQVTTANVHRRSTPDPSNPSSPLPTPKHQPPADAAQRISTRLLAAAPTAPSRPPAAADAPQAPLCFPELQLWSRLLTLKLEAAAGLAIGQVAPLATGGTLQQPFCAYSCIGVLPEGDPSSVERMLTVAAAQARGGQAAAAVHILDDLIERLQEDFSATSSSGSDYSSPSSSSAAAAAAGRSTQGPPLSPYLVPCCVYAQLLDQCEDPFADSSPTTSDTASTDTSTPTPSSNSSSTTTSSDLRRLVAFQIKERTKKAPKDSLTAPAASLARLLGPRHPVAKAMAEEAEGNLSVGARQARELRQQQATLAASMEVLKVSCCALCAVRRALCAVRRAPCAVRRALCAVRRAPCAVRRAPCAVRCAQRKPRGSDKPARFAHPLTPPQSPSQTHHRRHHRSNKAPS